MSDKAVCPFSGVTLPGDGTPTRPSPDLATWRDQSPATPLKYQDGHEGLIVTDYELARNVLSDPRFSMRPERMPEGPETKSSSGKEITNAALPAELPGPLDDDAQISEQSNLLILDGDQHLRLRRLITPHFTLKQVRSHHSWISDMVSSELQRISSFESKSSEIWNDYAKPIAAKTHCKVLGVPDTMYEEFVRLFAGPSTAQEKYDFIRSLISFRESQPGEDVVSSLLAESDISRHEVEGIMRLLLGAGRDSVAYLITTTLVALLTNPDQLEILRSKPELVPAATEEFMRYGAMFLTLFPRTALEDVDFDGYMISKGTSVSVSSVAANRDPKRFKEPDVFLVERDSFGHIGFSHGIHGCIGQQLARIEIAEAIGQLITAMPSLRLVEAEQLTPMPFAHPVAVYEAGEAIISWS
jgi:cytochrome P450